MKIKGDGPKLPLASQTSIANVSQQKEVGLDTTTAEPTTQLTEANVSKAWNSFAQQPSVASRSQTPVNQDSAFRQQMNLNAQQLPSGARVSSGNLAAQLGIDSSRLAVPSHAQLATTGSIQAPRVATKTSIQAAPLASPKSTSGPSTPSIREQASAAFEKVVEQSFMPGDLRSDNLASELAGKPELLEGLSVSEKGRLIEILKEGVTGNRDEGAILNILNSAGNVREFHSIAQMAGGAESIRENLHGKECDEFDFLVDKFNTSTQTKEHPLRGEAREMFEKVLHQSHMDWDSTSDNMARNLASNPRMLEALTPMEKGRLVQIMGSGVVGERDEESMIKVLRSSDNPNDFFQTVQMAGGAEFINSKVDWKEQGQFDYLMDKFRRQAATMPQQPTQPSAPGMTPAAPGMTPAAPGMTPAGGMMNPGTVAPTMFNPVTAMNPMMGMGMVQNPWSLPPVMGMNSGYGMGMPSYGVGAATGFGNQFDLGIGGTLKRGIGNFFRGLVRGVMNVLKTAVRVGVAAGIGFMMGGPAGAAMNAAGSLLGGGGMGMMSMMGMMGGGMGGMMGGMMGGDMMTTLFSTMMASSMPMGGMGGMGMMMGMF